MGRAGDTKWKTYFESNMELIKIIIILSFILKSFSCYSIDIGTLNFDLDSNKGFVTKRISNNTGKTQIYTINVYEVSKPTRNEIILDDGKHELLYNPRKFVLRSGESKNVKFYYNGNKNNERYFRVVFNEFGLPERLEQSIYLNLSINSILVVEPKNKIFKYNFDGLNNRLKNTGNSYFEVIVKEYCDQSDSDAFSKKMLPGEVVHNKILNDKNHVIFIFNNRYHIMDDKCKG